MFFEDRSLAPYEGDEPYLFLSYSHKDSEKAGEIIRVLKKNGFRVWYDEGITPGAEWDDNVAQAIVDCSYFVALISPGYIASANCRDELNYARTLEKQRLLVYLEETELPPGIAMRVNQLLALHMDKYEAEELFYERLFVAEGIDICRGEPEPVEAAPEEPADLIPEETEAQQEKASDPETEQEPPAEQEETAGKPADSPAEPEQKPKKNRNLAILIPAAILIILALILLPGKLKKPGSPEEHASPVVASEPEPPVSPAEPSITPTEIPAPTPTATPEPTPTPTPVPTPEPPTPEEQARMDAEKLYEDGKMREAALAFWKLGEEDRSRELWHEAAVHKTVATNGESAIGLKADGTVIGTGQNTSGQLNVGDWTDVIAVAVGEEHTLGLKADGTVVAVGANGYGECRVNDWSNIIQVDAGGRGSFGLKADGTVVAVGDDKTGRMKTEEWSDIVAIAAGRVHTVGLKTDGTVVAVGYNQYGQCEVGDWTDIIEIAASQFHTMGLKADGTVVAVGRPANKALEVSNWKNIQAIATSDNLTVGLREDGSLVWAGIQGGSQEPANSTPLPGWQDICEISGSATLSNLKLIGLREDGTAVIHLDHKHVTANIDGWSDLMTPEQQRKLASTSESLTEEEQAPLDAEKLYEDGKIREAALAFWKLGDEDRSRELWREAAVQKSIAIGAFHAVGLKADGTVLSTGNNPNGQCNVADWTDIIAVAAGDRHTLGLKADGTVVATGMNSAGECKLDEWKDIIQIAAGNRMSFGLKSDGTVVAEGLDQFGLKRVSDWTDVAAIAVSSAHVVGLKTDGTVIAAGINDNGQCSIEDWADIIEIDVGARHTLGLKADGTVVAVGENKRNACEVSNWHNIQSIAAAQRLSIGIREDGTLIWAGIQGKNGLSGFQNVSDMCGYGGTIKDSGLLILFEDGTVAGDMYTRGGSVDDWSNLMVPGNKM